MVAKVITGKNIRGVLRYNEHKVAQGKAECLLACRFGCEAAYLSFHQKLRRFELLIEQNKRVKTNAVHISLNFDPSERLNQDQLRRIASVYMEKIGFGEQPYLLYQHHDAAHPHVHIVTTNVQANGKRIDLHNIGRNQSETARKEIEQLFGLVPAQGKQVCKELKPVKLEKAVYGETETKQAIATVVREVTRTYKYTSLAELNAVLRPFNVIADRGKEESSMFQKKGLAYSLLDEQGTKVGVPIKASALPGKPMLAYLEKQFQLNEVLRRPHQYRLRERIDQVFREEPQTDRDRFVKGLAQQGVAVVFRESKEGRPYGITFVDHQHKVVFNGSDLGKSYSAKAILERLSPSTALANSQVGSTPQPVDKPIKPSRSAAHSEEPALSEPHLTRESDLARTLRELFTAQSNEQGIAHPARKKRRKKIKRGHSL